MGIVRYSFHFYMRYLSTFAATLRQDQLMRAKKHVFAMEKRKISKSEVPCPVLQWNLDISGHWLEESRRRC